MKHGSWLRAAVCAAGLACQAFGAEDAPKKSTPEGGKAKDETAEKLAVTTNQVTIGGAKLNYTARAGTLFLRDRENKPTAEIFFIAYTLNGFEDLSRRPVTFSFNGGPGSSSVWMHLGLLGPRRVALAPDGGAVPPPYKLLNNEFSLLDQTDLVFIDPVSTGFSRAVKPDDARQFYGVEEDSRAIADFIRLYVTRHGRWGSPKFLIGESYGTTRAAVLTAELRQRHRMNLNGIMLVSTVLNFQTLSFAAGNDLAYVLFLPAYTATAWHHKKLPDPWQAKPLAATLAAAEEFALGDYQAALLRGASLPAEPRRQVVQKLAAFTGLAPEFLDRSNLRVSMGRFASELLRSENRVVGRFDSRYTGLVRDREANQAPYDPSFEAVVSAFASTFNHYVRAELGYESDQPYETLAGVGPWNWGASNTYLNVAESLADSLTKNPFLKVHVSCGYYDLATPYFAARHTFNHLGVDPQLLKNITLDYYTAGHMMYLNTPDLEKQKRDLAHFIKSALAGP